MPEKTNDLRQVIAECAEPWRAIMLQLLRALGDPAIVGAPPILPLGAVGSEGQPLVCLELRCQLQLYLARALAAGLVDLDARQVEMVWAVLEGKKGSIIVREPRDYER